MPEPVDVRSRPPSLKDADSLAPRSVGPGDGDWFRVSAVANDSSDQAYPERIPQLAAAAI